MPLKRLSQVNFIIIVSRLPGGYIPLDPRYPPPPQHHQAILYPSLEFILRQKEEGGKRLSCVPDTDYNKSDWVSIPGFKKASTRRNYLRRSQPVQICRFSLEMEHFSNLCDNSSLTSNSLWKYLEVENFKVNTKWTQQFACKFYSRLDSNNLVNLEKYNTSHDSLVEIRNSYNSRHCT